MSAPILRTALLAVALFLDSAAALASPPPNDSWVSRASIAALPFAQSLPDIAEATTESSDPELFCILSDFADPGIHSVWYGYDTGADDEYVSLSAGGYDTMLGVYEGDPTQGFTAIRGGATTTEWHRRAARASMVCACGRTATIPSSSPTTRCTNCRR